MEDGRFWYTAGFATRVIKDLRQRSALVQRPLSERKCKERRDEPERALSGTAPAKRKEKLGKAYAAALASDQTP